MANFKWRSVDGDFSIAPNWANVTLKINPARVAPGPGDAVSFETSGGTITGSGDVGATAISGGLAGPWVLAGTFSTGSTHVSGLVRLAAGTQVAATDLTLDGAAVLTVGAGSALLASGLTIDGAAMLRVDPAGNAALGRPAGTAGTLTVAAGAALTARGGQVQAPIRDDGNVSSGDGFAVAGDLRGTGTLTLTPGLTLVSGALGVRTLAFQPGVAELRVQSLEGTAQVTGFQPGDTIDIRGASAFTLEQTATGMSLTAGGGTLELGAPPPGSQFNVYGDGHGGLQVLLDSPPPANAVQRTEPGVGSSSALGAAYEGPVNYLQRQYLEAGERGVALRANVPNIFLKGTVSDDALQVTTGSNVLDGGAGSNFLFGGDGADGGFDTFFLDGRGGAVTWSTIVNFHPGDQATIFGFHPGVSTRPYTASDGVGDYRGLTIHSELSGQGTGINASLTFAGIDQSTADAHFTFTTGTLAPDTPNATDYMLIQYNR